MPQETQVADLRSDIAYAWHLVKAYWGSQSWKSAGIYLALSVALNLLMVRMSVASAHWVAAFTDALVAKDVAASKKQLLVGLSVMATVTLVTCVQGILRELMTIGWRHRLTEYFLGKWLSNGRFAEIEREGSIQNVDQRMAVDIAQIPRTVGDITLNVISEIGLIASFSVVLWRASGETLLPIAGRVISIPGLMVWLAIAAALLRIFLVHFVGRSVTPVTIRQEGYEADFRASLIRVREYSDAVAFEDGAMAERHNLQGRFARVRENFIRRIFLISWVSFVTSLSGTIVSVLPMIVNAPRVLAGTMTIGMTTEMAFAFGSVSSALAYFANAYITIADARATVQRLKLFDRMLDRPLRTEIRHTPVDLCQFSADDLTLERPDGTRLLILGHLRLAPGDRILLKGPSGCGKSSLLKAFAGLWPYGSGSIEVPANGQVMFLPQTAYLPEGSIAAALSYPLDPDAFAHADQASALKRCQLAGYVEDIGKEDNWARRLSPGEKQRMAVARVLLHKPAFLFLDEATSALDPDLENALYSALVTDLPNTAILSVAHRTGVARFHNRTIEMLALPSDAASMFAVHVVGVSPIDDRAVQPTTPLPAYDVAPASVRSCSCSRHESRSNESTVGD